MTNMIKCESCGKHPAFYIRDSYIKSEPALKICCVCADRMIAKIPGIKEVLNIREIDDKLLARKETL
jgi:hypothetical protein